ncbi:hypothetical protein [Nostoc favosum]|uniref:Transposase n=1 Tax=Nostoc favosum CHAB5714 TaxID=2780399 RepID=A0ABS8I4Z8_9NOSO|nr:hypothetical protein [Nostoc favosum]MCC5599270.1 hypothetical protein [Nostoc favosum CHAB5714]
MGNGEWGIGHWALGIGHWALVISLSLLPLMMIERGWNDTRSILEKLSVSLHPVALPFLVRYCIKIKLTLIKILVGIAIMRQSLYGGAYKRSN